jgi:glutamate-1-semialdehyde aminotransferase
MMPLNTRFALSDAAYERAIKVIPTASQTFSKSSLQYVKGASPLFIERGEGCVVWDLDGNEYIDMVGALLPVILGYCDPDVDDAIMRQLGRGISFSLATTLESDLAERLVDLIPCAEMVRFGKNGSDATSAAVRLARACTGRPKIACCGYHGWHDWYIGSTTRDLGVPEAVGALTSKFPYNDSDALEALLRAQPDEYAAIILEPMAFESPSPGFLPHLRALADEYGAILIFDEIVTGFRMDLGGAQKYFGITPDLAAFGKAMGNGMPISAVVGKRTYMQRMDDIFFSGTFGGESLSLAAAIATIDKLKREDGSKTLWSTGGRVKEGVTQALEGTSLADCIDVIGENWWPGLRVGPFGGAASEAVVTSLLRQELVRHGVLQCATMNLSLAHAAEGVVDTLLARYRAAFSALSDHLDSGDSINRLLGESVRPVFSVRD